MTREGVRDINEKFLKAESFTLKLKRKKKFVKVFSLSHTLRPIIYRNNESSKKKNLQTTFFPH